MPICGSMSIQCYNEAEDLLLIDEFKQGLSSSSTAGSGRGETNCNCLPACTSISYEAELSQADFNWQELFKAYKNPVDEFPG